MTADDLPRWAAEAACRDAVVRTALRLDEGDLDGHAEGFTADACLQRPDGSVLQGRAAILAAYRARPASRLTCHLLGAGVVDLLAADRARCRTPVLLWAGDRSDAAGAQGRPRHGPALVGRFDDELQRGDDGHWRIARRVARFDLHGPAA